MDVKVDSYYIIDIGLHLKTEPEEVSAAVAPADRHIPIQIDGNGKVRRESQHWECNVLCSHLDVVKAVEADFLEVEFPLFINEAEDGDRSMSKQVSDQVKRACKSDIDKKKRKMKVLVKLHACDVCGKSFGQKRDLSRHRQIHTGEKTFVCVTCGKAFSKKVHLDHHELIHSGKRPYECTTCKKAFRQKKDLEQHSLIHSGEKPNSCDYCRQQYRHKSTLIKHRRVHTGEKPYTCNSCDKAFSRLDTLAEHKHVHSGAKPFLCKTCDKSFTTKSNMNKHERLHVMHVDMVLAV